MELLKDCGSFSIGAQRLTELQKTFWAGYADDVMTADEIKRMYERTHYVVDPHTAVGAHVLRQYREQTGDHTPAVLLATASPYKFSTDVLRSLWGAERVQDMSPTQCADELQKLSGVPVPKQISELDSLPVRHKAVCDTSAMESALLDALRG